MNRLLLASTFLFTIAGSALAADTVVYEPVSAPEVAPAGFVWTGGYVGLVAGVNFLKGETTIPNYEPKGYNPDSTSATIGGKIGYNYQFANNLVLGAEASLVAVFNDGSDFTFSDEFIRVGQDWQAQIVAKAGYAIDRFLPYVKGGVAFIGIDDVQYLSESFGDSSPLSRTYTGWTVGVGADYAFNDKWILGADYSYAKFGGHDFDNDDIGPTIVKPSTHTVSVSLSYKF